MKKFLSLLLLLPCVAANAQVLRDDLVTPDGSVRAAAIHKNKLYIAGDFNTVGNYTGNAAMIDRADSRKLYPFPVIDGEIFASLSDGKGGWYLGGSFSKAGSVSVRNIVHINENGDIDTGFSARATGKVLALALANNTLYIGGEFETVNDSARRFVAALDPSSGRLRSWNPDVNGAVYTLAANDSTVYLGGVFSFVSGRTRKYLAALDTAGNVRTFNPAPDREVDAILLSGSTLFAGGSFSVINGSGSSSLVALDALSGQVLPNTPKSPVSYVRSLALSANILFAGGGVPAVKGSGFIKGFEAATGQLAAEIPPLFFQTTQEQLGGSVRAITVHDSVVYFGGWFNRFDGRTAAHSAAFNFRSGKALPWTAMVNAEIHTMANAGGRIFAAGKFSSAGGEVREGLAAIDLGTGQLDPWYPGSLKGINAIAVSDSAVYVGGSFTNIAGSPRNYLAAFDHKARLLPWNPNPDARIISMLLSDTSLYITGYFASVGGKARMTAAALSSVSGTVLPWNPDIGSQINNAYYISAPVPNIYVAGQFLNVGGQTRRYLAEIDSSTYEATSWNPIPNMANTGLPIIRALAVTSSRVYLGGTSFESTMNGRTGLAAFSRTSAELENWDPAPDGTINAIFPDQSNVYVSGSFSSIGGTARTGAAAIDMINGKATAWNLAMAGVAETILRDEENGQIIFAGGFQSAMGNPKYRYLLSSTPSGPYTSVTEEGDRRDNFMSIAPNPASGLLHISLGNELSSECSIAVYSLLGEKVLELGNIPPGQNRISLDAGNIPAGIYTLVLRTGATCHTEKIVIGR